SVADSGKDSRDPSSLGGGQTKTLKSGIARFSHFNPATLAVEESRTLGFLLVVTKLMEGCRYF
ncbi:hypothetical protein AFLA_000059, partial [Aspergillus flavus NRRL3357]